ncbi:MAG: CRISPR-associated helicase Cas3' [Deltaproteobacteria bacterium RBG_16_71_12]|nr:MAG: CRISPR-associated helicase Cas3' [Deltaproteobacteria bacterium RBG_16_71_12]
MALFGAGLVDGLYFALPTRTAATQIHGRLLEAAKLAFTSPPPVVLAVPGYLRVDDVDGAQLPHFRVLWPEDQERFRYRAWAAEQPKRYLAGTVVVGTIDQVLLSSLQVGHAHLRATALLRHLLVVDEVHASDAYMTRILEEVLAYHCAGGGHALLLSATLGGEARARLLSPNAGFSLARPSLAESIAAPYPALTSMGQRPATIAHDGRVREVEVRTAPLLEQPDTVAAAALVAALEGAKVLVLRNTVNDCLETQTAIEARARTICRDDLLFSCRDVITPHHARYARADRVALDRAIEGRFGKTRPDGGCVVVATQTVQQSLDLDADVLFTDLCPMDVLLQRIGRLHRHVRTRPQGFADAIVHLLVPTDRNLGTLVRSDGRGRHHHGLGSVYDDLRVLEATWRCIERSRQWVIPGDCRRLVEETVHSDALAAIVRELGGPWELHAQNVIGGVSGQARIAELGLVDRAKPYAAQPFASDRKIQSRLGEGDRLVSFATAFVAAFGDNVDVLSLRAAWSRGAGPEEEMATDVEQLARGIHFTFGGRRFVYDRLGLRPHIEDVVSVEDDDA